MCKVLTSNEDPTALNDQVTNAFLSSPAPLMGTSATTQLTGIPRITPVNSPLFCL